MSCCKPIPELPPLCRKKEEWPLSRSSLFHSEEPAQQAPQGLGRLPDNDSHGPLPFQRRRQQPQPQAMRRNATRNSSAPTGKMAAIRIPDPRAMAKIPRRYPPPFQRNIPFTLPSSAPVYPAGQGVGTGAGKNFVSGPPEHGMKRAAGEAPAALFIQMRRGRGPADSPRGCRYLFRCRQRHSRRSPAPSPRRVVR